jgi:hypothetical protein
MGEVAILFFIIWVVAVTFLAPALLKWLWNKTIPAISTVRAVTYWQAFRLFLICTLLFGGPPTFLHFNA